jgi:hypothetical protein
MQIILATDILHDVVAVSTLVPLMTLVTNLVLTGRVVYQQVGTGMKLLI